jgi:hypothetical protein
MPKLPSSIFGPDLDPGDSRPALPPLPTDTFSRLTKTMDRARRTFAKVGLRPYRVYLVAETFAVEAGRGPGELTWDELDPSPQVFPLSMAYIASSGGRLMEGAVRLEDVSRERRLEELSLRTIFGDDLPKNMRGYYALVPKGQLLARFYKVAGEPILEPLGWRVTLNPWAGKASVPGPHVDL